MQRSLTYAQAQAVRAVYKRLTESITPPAPNGSRYPSKLDQADGAVTQKQIAHALGVSESIINRIINGESYRNPPGTPRQIKNTLTASDKERIRSLFRQGLTVTQIRRYHYPDLPKVNLEYYNRQIRLERQNPSGYQLPLDLPSESESYE